MSGRVQSIAVVGRDAPLWLTAAALQRALGCTGVKVRAVELGSMLAPADVYAAVPSLASLHRLLGLEEQVVLDVCNGVPMVGQRFSNWAKGAPPFLVAYDDELPTGGDLAFVQYWTKGTLEGLQVGYQEFSLGCASARLNAVPSASPRSAVLGASYGYHLDSAIYSELIKQLALRLGVEASEKDVGRICSSGEWIDGIDFADGTRATADLYIDASGREGRLIGTLAGAEFESFKEWLPCDRTFAANAPRLPRLPAFSQISAFHGGWVGMFPLQDRTAILVAYDSGAVSDSDIAGLVSVVARMPISGDAAVSEIRTGMQRSPWTGNCIAIGEAAIALDPIDAVELQLTHGCISHLMTLFPATADEFPEAEAYNRTVRLFGSNIRDFQAAHYILNRRFDEPMWDRVRARQMPPGLKRKVDMFRARALVPINDEESFHDQLWTLLLLGSGVIPEGYDPRIDSLSDQQHIEAVQGRLKEVAAMARQMPSVEQFLGIAQSAPAQVIG